MAWRILIKKVPKSFYEQIEGNHERTQQRWKFFFGLILLASLVNAIKEQQTQIDALKN